MQFNNTSIRTRLMWAFSLLLALLVILSVLSYQGFQSISISAHELVDRKARLAFLSDRANQYAQTAANSLLRLLLTTERDARVPLYATMDEALNANDRAMLQIETSTAEYMPPVRVSELRELRNRYSVLFQETVEQIELSGPKSAKRHFETKTEPALKALLEATAQLALMQQDAMQSEVQRLTTGAETAQKRIVLIGVFALLSGAALGVLVARSIARPINEAAMLAASIAGGDYSREIPSAGSNEIGSMLRALGVMRKQIAEREAHISRIAYVDELTNLANRARFFEDFEQSQSRFGALLLLDINRFSAINKALGHAVGDALLRGVAERLKATLGEHDLLARLWGDEFALLLCSANKATAVAAAERIRTLLREPITIDGQRLDLDASIGVALFPDDSTDVSKLLRMADDALRSAKRRHTGIAEAQPNADEPASEQLTLIGEMRDALEHGDFEVFYQPKLDLKLNRITGAEALIRWNHPHRGLIPPNQFIPFAEQTGFIREITPWLLDRVVSDTSRWRHAGLELVISANLSTHDLLNTNLFSGVIDALAREQLPPSALCLEITESALMDDPERALQNLHMLSACGINLAIDDYGSGQASLAYVRNLPVHELKIDRMFITGVDSAPKNAAIVRSTVLLCHELNLVVVAEGAEHASEINWLRGNGCDLVQGYGIAKPMPAGEFPDWVLKFNTSAAPTDVLNNARE